MTNEDIATAYERSAALIEESGWCQYSSSNVHGQHCLTGALYTVIPEPGAYLFPLVNMLHREGRMAWSNPFATRWNDNLPRKNGKRTVIRALREWV